MTLGERIVHYRKRQGLSQEQLSQRLGVSRQSVSKWERDESLPEADKLPLLAKTLGVSLDTLLRTAPLRLHTRLRDCSLCLIKKQSACQPGISAGANCLSAPFFCTIHKDAPAPSVHFPYDFSKFPCGGKKTCLPEFSL